MNEALPIILILVSLSFWGGLLYIWIKGRSVESWPSTTGKVIKSYVKEELDHDPENGSMLMYSPHIEYEYIVDSVRYIDSRVGLVEGASSWKAPAERKVNLFPDGLDVEVYYNPNKPEESYLERGVSVFSYITLSVLATISSLWAIYV